MSNRRPGYGVCLALLLALSVVPVGARAQERSQESPYDPHSVHFPEGGLGLAEAVQTTLQNDPEIKLQTTNASFREGVVRQQKGFFDLTLSGSASSEYRKQEVRESRQDTERSKRDDLDALIAEGDRFQPQATQLLNELRAALAAPPGQERISDPILQAQITLLDALLNQLTDPTARQNLANLRRKILEDNANATAAQLQTGLEELVKLKDKRRRLGDTPIEEVFYKTTFALNMSKRLRSGLVISPFMDSRLDGTNFKDKEIAAEFGGKGIEDLYTFRAGLDLTLPLLRGRGAGTVAASERSAVLEHSASLLVAKHQSSVSALRTVRAYWDLKAAQEALAVSNHSGELQDRLLDATQKLINGGEMPGADLARAQASHMRSKARVQESLRRVHEASVNLAQAMGVVVTDDPATLPLARDAFPTPSQDTLPAEPWTAALVRGAPTRRDDLKASAFREESGKVLVKGAQLDLKPKLDLTGRTFFTSLGEIEVGSAIDRWVGPSVSGTLSLEVPFGNNTLRGRWLQRDADYRTRRIAAADLERQIKLNVVRTSGSLQEAATRVQLAQKAVEYSRKTIESELEKFQAGDATLVDAIITEDQQTEALLTLVTAQQDYAQLVAQLRFESGSLVTDAATVVPANLVTVPRGAQP